MMRPVILSLFALLTLSTRAFCTVTDTSWCNHQLRPELKNLHEVKTSHPWYKVYDVGHHTYAIVEPYNWEETICYLIIGSNKALLFDTGMGMDHVLPVIKELTHLPIWVLNSHTHPDHIGGNYEFSHIMAMNTAYTHHSAANGYSHQQVRDEVTPGSICLSRLPGFDTAHYYIHPFTVTRYINNGYIINLGNRQLKVIRTPGHTPDAICLYDEQARYLWTGDSFYHGPIFLFDEATNLHDYGTSIALIARYACNATWVLPAHNLPMVKPTELIAAANAYTQIVTGNKKVSAADGDVLTYDFGQFSFKIGKQYLNQLKGLKGKM